MLVSARTGEGVDAWRDWLRERAGRGRRAGVSRARRHRPRRRALERARWPPASASSRPRPTRIARLCHRMAERFARGGRLIALGARRRRAPTSRHVAVEFVHPVIVGKRALPALGRVEGGPLGALAIAEPDDIAIAFGAGAEVAARRARGAAA